MHKKTVRCDNTGYFGKKIFAGCRCSSIEPTKILKIFYDKDKMDVETLCLCDACTEAIGKDAKRHGYGTEVASYD